MHSLRLCMFFTPKQGAEVKMSGPAGRGDSGRTRVKNSAKQGFYGRIAG